VQLSGVPFVAVAPKVGHPLAHIPAVAVLSEELGDDVTALALTSRALNPQHVQLTSDIAEGEMGAETCYLLHRPAARLFADELLSGAIEGARRLPAGNRENSDRRPRAAPHRHRAGKRRLSPSPSRTTSRTIMSHARVRQAATTAIAGAVRDCRGAHVSWRQSGDAVLEGHYTGRAGCECGVARVNGVGSQVQPFQTAARTGTSM
jgi:hypothetical protein